MLHNDDTYSVVACVPSLNSSKSTLKAPSMGAQDTSSMGRTVSPSVASKKVAPFAFSLQRQARMKSYMFKQLKQHTTDGAARHD